MPPPIQPRAPLPVYEDYEGPDDYLSDDDLSPNDLNVLNTDYTAQRDLNLHSGLQQPTSNQYLPYSSDVRTRPSRRSGDAEKQDLTAHTPLRIPPRLSSVPTAYAHHGHRAEAYPPTQRRRPLIDYIKNEWAHTTSAPGAALSPISDDEWEWDLPVWIQCCFLPRFQRVMLILLAVSFFTWGNWHTWIGPRYNEASALNWSIKQRHKLGEGWFGENMRPEFFDMVQLRTLDESLVPNEASDNRLIIIGDVHGCYIELMALLDDCQYSSARDHLIFTGDLIAKGPDSSAIVDLAMEANASCVRGNHEDRVLLAHRDMSTDPSDSLDVANKNKKNTTSSPSTSLNLAKGSSSDTADSSPLPLDEESFMHGDISDRMLARHLTTQQLAWLAACPVILDVGDIEQLGAVHIAHAGLVPGVSLTQQDPVGSMTMRTIDLSTHVPSSNPKGVAWWKLWNKYQAASPTTARSTVVYGHDSKVGLNVLDYSIGLDSGCVSGGRLSALVIEGGAGLGGSKVVSVECQDYGKMEEALLKAYGG